MQGVATHWKGWGCVLGTGGQKGYRQIVLDIACPLETREMQW